MITIWLYIFFDSFEKFFLFFIVFSQPHIYQIFNYNLNLPTSKFNFSDIALFSPASVSISLTALAISFDKSVTFSMPLVFSSTTIFTSEIASRISSIFAFNFSLANANSFPFISKTSKNLPLINALGNNFIKNNPRQALCRGFSVTQKVKLCSYGFFLLLCHRRISYR